MDKCYDRLNLADLDLDHSPLVRAGNIRVKPPSLRDNTALAERFCRAVENEWNLAEVTLAASLEPKLVDFYTRARNEIWTACRIQGDRGQVVLTADQRPGPTLGLAVDIGSTTLVMALVDLENPTVVEQITRPNPQGRYGADILTRAHFAEKNDGLTVLVGALRRAINQGVAELAGRCNIAPEFIPVVSLAGNTTMTHFLLGLPVRTLIREPYVPVVNRPGELTAGDIGLEVAPQAPVLIMPNKGAYFGGDLMAGLVVSGLARAEKPCMMVDVGTNAEVVLGQRDWLIGAAGAAGPALEGGVASMGMVAAPGAIDRVRIDRETGEVALTTIGDAPPKGICGSGLIDLFAELYLSGLIDFQGKLTLKPGAPRRVETDEGPAFVVAFAKETENGRPITLSEVELDILTRSKAGMYTIINTVLLSVGLTADQIDRFYVAGTFGQYIDPSMAVAVGMLPDLPLSRFVPLGNSSLKGAVLALLSAKARKQVDDVWKRLTYLEMNVNQDLMNRFSAARFIPHTDRKLFPSVGTTII